MSNYNFSPAQGRQSSVVLNRNQATGDYRIVISVCSRRTTEVIRVNIVTGALEQENDRVCESTYENEAEALDALKSVGYDVVERGHALLGYAAVGATAGLLLATRVREKGVLPGGHALHLVTDSQWVLVPLANDAASEVYAAALAGAAPPPARQDQDFWRAVQQFTLNNAHYYCETADISRPFPSPEDPSNPNPEFVWNSWLRQPLVDMGLFAHCPPLLQGAVESSAQAHPGGGAFSMALLSRRSRRHPGTRYIARGLNERAGPGNEIESELIVWTHPRPAGGVGGVSAAGAAGEPGPLRWARVVWRRGTVPIWWGVQLQSLQKGLQAEVYVRSDEPYRGTVSYFRGVQRQHVPRPRLPPPGGADAGGAAQAAAAAAAAAEARPGEDPSAEVPITCVNLLHCNPKKAAELMLSSHFQEVIAIARGCGSCAATHESMRHVRRKLGGDVPIRVVNFDWHGNMGNLTEEKAVEGFWAFMEGLLRVTGMASGTMEPTAEARARRQRHQQQAAAGAPNAAQRGAVGPPADADAGSSSGPGGAPATPWGSGWRMQWCTQQNGVIRINCADSLDRTNAASCFGMLPALEEGLRLIGVQLDVGAIAPATSALLRSKQHSSQSSAGSGAELAAQEPAPALPQGWEVREHAWRPLYIDHVNKRTQWEPPVVPGTRPQSASVAEGASTPPRPPGSGGGGRLMQSAAELLGRLQRSSPTPGWGGEQSPGAGGGQRRTADAAAQHTRSSSFGGLGSLMKRERSAPDLSLPSANVPLTAISPAAPAAEASPAAVPPAAITPAAPTASSQQLSLQDVRDRLLKEAVADYVEMFKVHGDIHSFLYTGSPAMHSHVLSLITQSRQSYGATSGNLRVAVQRRWNNTVSDTARQQAIELFLGMNLGRHFPGMPVLYEDRTDLGPLEPEDLEPPEPAAPPAGGGAAGAPRGDAALPVGGAALAVPGLTEHDGRLGVTTPLIDLEPLDEGSSAGGSPGNAALLHAMHGSSSNSAMLGAPGAPGGSPRASSSGGSEVAGVGGLGPAPPPLDSASRSVAALASQQMQDLLL
eukprot:scaffold11.g3928.t1